MWHHTISCWSCTLPTRAKISTVAALRPGLINIQLWHRFREAEKKELTTFGTTRSIRGYFMKAPVEAKDTMDSHVTGNGGVSGHRLGWEVIVTVGAVEERLSPLAVDKICLQDEAWARAGHWVQGATAWWRAIVHIKTAYGEKERGRKTHRSESDNVCTMYCKFLHCFDDIWQIKQHYAKLQKNN